MNVVNIQNADNQIQKNCLVSYHTNLISTFMKFFLLLLSLIFLSCNSVTSNEKTIYEAGNTPLETIKSMYKSYDEAHALFNLQDYYMNKNLDDVLESLEVVETVDHTLEHGETLNLVFYKFYVGTTMFRDVEHLIERDGKYYRSYHYIGGYDSEQSEKDLAEKIKEWKTDDTF